MVLGELILKCPYCNTETKFITEMINPVIVYCHGCDRSVILQNSKIYTLPVEFIHELSKQYNTRACGRIISADISESAKDLITSNKINVLHDLLSKSMDVKDFLKNIRQL